MGAGRRRGPGGIDVLVNNASGFGMGDDEEGWAAGLSVDVLAMVRSSRAALPWLQRAGAAGGASIIHISSIAAFRPSTRTAAYAAVKAAMNSYTGSQAAMLSRQGIRVNAIAPGSIEFPGGVWDQRKTDNPTLYERTLKRHPLRPLRHARRSRRGRPVPGIAARPLDHGAGSRRRRWPVAWGLNQFESISRVSAPRRPRARAVAPPIATLNLHTPFSSEE